MTSYYEPEWKRIICLCAVKVSHSESNGLHAKILLYELYFYLYSVI